MSEMLRYPLFYCIAGGALAAAFENVRGSFWWGFCILSALISVYGWLAKGERDTGRYETGDNCYFIGFVYTLSIISLSLALDAQKLLSDVSDGAGETGGGLPQLLGTVGIALGTSVVGMLWRFGLTYNIKISKDEFERLVGRTAVAANKLEAAVSITGKSAANADESLRAVAGAAQLYADKMLSETGKIGEHMTAVAGKMFDDFGNRIADTLQKTQFDNVREELQEAVEEHRNAAVAVGESLKASIGELNNASASAAAAASKVNEELDALNFTIAAVPGQAAASVKAGMEEMEKSVAAHLQKITLSINNALDKMQSEIGGGKWRVIADAADNFSAQVEKMNESMQQIARQQDLMINTAAGDVERIKEMRASFDSLIKDLRKDSEEIIKIKEKYREQFNLAAEEALKETHLLYAKLIKGAEVALAAVHDSGAISGDLRKIAAHLETISVQLKNTGDKT